MTELNAQFRDDELDNEDVLLRKAFLNLQQTVSDFMIRTGRSINDMTTDERQALVDRIDPHLEFEIESSEDLYVGMPIVIKGVGAFFAVDRGGIFNGAQITTEGDVITGVVSDVQSLVVPTREIIRSTGPNDEIPTYDLSLSAAVIIKEAKFNTAASSDGTYQVVHDLGEFSILIPTIYGMDVRVADVAA